MPMKEVSKRLPSITPSSLCKRASQNEYLSVRVEKIYLPVQLSHTGSRARITGHTCGPAQLCVAETRKTSRLLRLSHPSTLIVEQNMSSMAVQTRISNIAAISSTHARDCSGVMLSAADGSNRRWLLRSGTLRLVDWNLTSFRNNLNLAIGTRRCDRFHRDKAQKRTETGRLVLKRGRVVCNEVQRVKIGNRRGLVCVVSGRKGWQILDLKVSS